MNDGKRSTHQRWTAAEDDILREHYGRRPPAEVAKLLGRSPGACMSRVCHLKDPAERRPVIIGATVHDYFSDVYTAAQAYVLGLLAADGNVASGHPRVNLGLQFKDASAVEFVRDQINPGARLSPSKDGRVVLQVTSRQMVADLARFGIVPRKSRILPWPSTLGDLQRPYLLGYFDGDGCAYLPRDRHGQERPGWTVCSGSERFLIEMKNYIRYACGVQLWKIQHRKAADLWQVAVTGRGAFVLSEWLHQEGLGLARKRFPEHVLAPYRVPGLIVTGGWPRRGVADTSPGPSDTLF